MHKTYWLIALGKQRLFPMAVAPNTRDKARMEVSALNCPGRLDGLRWRVICTREHKV